MRGTLGLVLAWFLPPITQAAIVDPGLPTGTQYRLIFVTSTTTAATSDDIATYDAIVQAAAAGLETEGYGLATQYKVLGSSSNAYARDHTGTNTSPGLPIYNTAGLKVADDYADLWAYDIDAAVGYNESGDMRSVNVWTGTTYEGYTHPNRLGDSTETVYGVSNLRWLAMGSVILLGV